MDAAQIRLQNQIVPNTLNFGAEATTPVVVQTPPATSESSSTGTILVGVASLGAAAFAGYVLHKTVKLGKVAEEAKNGVKGLAEDLKKLKKPEGDVPAPKTTGVEAPKVETPTAPPVGTPTATQAKTGDVATQAGAETPKHYVPKHEAVGDFNEAEILTQTPTTIPTPVVTRTTPSSASRRAAVMKQAIADSPEIQTVHVAKQSGKPKAVQPKKSSKTQTAQPSGEAPVKHYVPKHEAVGDFDEAEIPTAEAPAITPAAEAPKSFIEEGLEKIRLWKENLLNPAPVATPAPPAPAVVEEGSFVEKGLQRIKELYGRKED